MNVPGCEAMPLQNAGMFHCRRNELVPRPSLQKPIRRLRAAGGKRHSLRLYLENPSYGFTGILDNCASLTSFSVDRRRISGAIEGSHHRIARLRPKR